jgi:hypothetical protein
MLRPPRLAPLFLVSALAHAAPVGLHCPEGRPALVLITEGVPETLLPAVEQEVAVEASRLGLTACRTADVAPVITARLLRVPVGFRLEAASVQGRHLSREVPVTGETEEAALELATILGDLIQEARNPEPARPAPTSSPWALGARAAFEGFPRGPGWLFGGDVTLRLQAGRLSALAALGGRGSRSFATSAGEVSAATVAAGLFGRYALLQSGPWALCGELGLTGAAVHFGATPTDGSTAAPAWRPELDARLGLLLQGPLHLELGVAALAPLLGAQATVDGVPLTGLTGPGLAATLGFALGETP